MRISYGSSDVCSSDLVTARACPDRPPGGRRCGSLHSVGRPLLPDREARVHLTPDSGLMLPAPRVTQGIAWATIAAFVLLFVSGSGAREAYAYMAGLVPARISGTITVPGGFPIILTPITATLLHGSIAHLGFNMVMFYYLGRMVEGMLGSGRLLILYVDGSYAAAFAEYLVSPASIVPVIC